MAINKSLQELINISRKVGTDTSLVQGGGGNTSMKTADGKYMYIKASGTALKDMSPQTGYRRLNLERILEIVKNPDTAKLDPDQREQAVLNSLMTSCQDDIDSNARPSVESHLHAMLDRCVVHLHPYVVGAFVNAKNGKDKLEKILSSEKYPPLWVPYCDPGFMLAVKVGQLSAEYELVHKHKPQLLFLEKHGVFFAGPSAQKTLRIVNRVIKKLTESIKTPKASRTPSPDEQEIKRIRAAVRGAVFDATGQHAAVRHFMNDTIASFMKRPDASKLLSPAALTPDELIYASGGPLWISSPDRKKIASKLNRQIERSQKPSTSFLVPGIGLFVASEPGTVEVIGSVETGSLFARAAAASMGGVNALNKRQRNFLLNWESESFRKNLMAGSAAGKVQNRIAIVTGAGSGLGRSIALGLAKEGACVGLADIDFNAAQETEKLIRSQMPKAQLLPVNCNVINEQSVQEGIETILNKWGGLDIAVNAAGIAPAFSLVDLPVDKWRMAVEVNLTGYFLIAKHSARVMIDQAIGGNIINLTSKSGLEPSKNNTPYNATKSGEIHMARGWAMELGEHGIRVNCVAPGNVFEGSKIWNPEYMKVCAKKYGIKPDEVIDYYTSKTSLKREIKGRDIADAVVFLASDNARTITGQVIVADAGQVWVR